MERKFELPGDYRRQIAQVFVFKNAKQSGLLLIPEEDSLIHIGSDVDISIAGIAVRFLLGDKIVLKKGTEYTFSADIPIGIA